MSGRQELRINYSLCTIITTVISFQEVKNDLLRLMKQEDPLFAALFQEWYHTGSYYDGLRVGDPREFDLNVMLNLSIFKPFLIFDTGPKPGFVTIRHNRESLALRHGVPKDHRFASVMPKFAKMFDEEQYLDVEKMKRWIESILSKVRHKICSPYYKVCVAHKGHVIELSFYNFCYISDISSQERSRTQPPSPPSHG
jgi:hypothetical protein